MRNEIKIVPLTKALRGEWDGVVAASDDAWFYHQYDWMTEVNERVWGYRSESFLIRDGGRVVGICPLFFRERKLFPGVRWQFLSTGGFGTAGPACIPDLNPIQRRACLSVAFGAIDRIAEAMRVTCVDVRLPPLAPASIASQPIPSLPFSDFGFRDRSTHAYLISLHGRSAEDLWRSLTVSCRNTIRKAQRNGITVHAVDAIASLEQYYALHRMTYHRTGAQPHPRRYFEVIYRNNWATHVVAKHEGKIIAALNLLTFKRGALYWSSASEPLALSLGANNLLQWHAMQWACAQQFDWYEVGEAFLHPTDAKQGGLTAYKASFGGHLFPFHQYVKVYRPLHQRSYVALQYARRFLARAVT